MTLDADDIKRIARKIDTFCTAENIRDHEIAVSILDVICAAHYGLTASEALGPVSPAYLKRVIHYANKVQS
jgi:hypothetical protein